MTSKEIFEIYKKFKDKYVLSEGHLVFIKKDGKMVIDKERSIVYSFNSEDPKVDEAIFHEDEDWDKIIDKEGGYDIKALLGYNKEEREDGYIACPAYFEICEMEVFFRFPMDQILLFEGENISTDDLPFI